MPPCPSLCKLGSGGRTIRRMQDYGLSGESIICFAGEDWWYHHPHSKNHIFKRLATQNRVLFVNSLGMGLPAISNADFLLKLRRKLKSYLRWLRKVPEGLYVLTPLSFPFYDSGVARFLNRLLLIAQIRLVMALCGMQKPVLWIAIPFAADLLDRLDARLVVYQITDKYEAQEDSTVSRRVIQRSEEHTSELQSRLHLVCRLLLEKKKTNPTPFTY